MPLSRLKKFAAAPARRANLEPLENRVLFAIVVAENLLVDVDATTLPLTQGTALPTIANNGTLGGVFEAKGGGTMVPMLNRPLPSANSGTMGIHLDGNDFLQHVVAAAGALVPAPAGITGSGNRSIETWVWNPSVANEETMLSWGKRQGPNGTNESFNYGSNGDYGALGHWGPQDMGWGPTVPAAGRWHHLAYTYDGTTGRVYVDGVETFSEAIALNTHSSNPPAPAEPVLPIQIGAQMEGNGTTVTEGLRGSLTLGKVRVHDGVLSAADVKANYDEEKAQFVEPGFPPPPATPTKLVDIDATNLPEGPITSIENTGTAGGFFEPRGGAADTIPSIDQPLPTSATGTRGIRLDGEDFLQHVVAQGGALKPAPAEVTGYDPYTTIEAWVWNPSLPPEETILSWGRRGTDGRNMSFNYGHNGGWGAMGHWGPTDIGWGPNAPSPRQWHHVAYTYDGTTQRVFIDGVETTSEPVSRGALNIYPDSPITIGAQIEPDGTTVTEALRGSLTVGRARVYHGVLTPDQIAANFNAEKADFVEPDESPANLTSGPTHRYSFSNAAGDAATGTVIEDLVGEADAIVKGSGATFTGSRLTLPGGPSATAPYVDLPNFLLYDSSPDAGFGGTGQISLEGWVRHTGNHNWGRFFDFGASTGGEVQAPGGTGDGTTYWMFSQFATDTALRRTELITAPGSAQNRTLDTAATPLNTDVHFVATWNEATGEVTLYEQGVEVANFNTPMKFTSIQDVNNWLGRSNYFGDANLQGEYDEFRIYDRVLTAQEVAGNFLAGADVVNTPGATPVVSEVYVRGRDDMADGQATVRIDEWSDAFRTYLQQQGVGHAEYGYRVFSGGTANTEVLSWLNVYEVVVRYATAPTGSGIPTVGSVTVTGQKGGAYTITGVAPVTGDPTAFVLTLGKPLGGGDPVTGTAPSRFTENGDRITFGVTGAGAGGADFSLPVAVLQGDAFHGDENVGGSLTHTVNANDFTEVKRRSFRNTTNNQGVGSATPYTIFHDVDGNGTVNAIDFTEVKRRSFHNLPAPTAAAAQSLSIAPVAEELFSKQKVL